jgi:ABC-type nitrate/sulfonate/bicarbonate transport system ATPase subunit
MEAWAKKRIAPVIVTHDVDEAILVADRVVAGPAHRSAAATLAPALRESLIGFFEECEHGST